MSKRILCIVAGCAVVLACVGIAYGAAVKIRWFENIGGPEGADGMAILKYGQGQDNTSAQVILSDVLPNTPYVVALRVPGTWELDGTDAVVDDGFFPISAGTSGQLVTNSRGHLTFHGSTTPGSGDWSGSDVLIFSLSDWQDASPPFPISIPVRLVGYNPTAP